jgi:hypothetical protein
MNNLYLRLVCVWSIFIFCFSGNILAQESQDFDLPDISDFEQSIPPTTDSIIPATTPAIEYVAPTQNVQTSVPVETVPVQMVEPVQTSNPVVPTDTIVTDTTPLPSFDSQSTALPVIVDTASEITPTVQTAPIVTPIVQQTSTPIQPWIKSGWGINLSGGSNLFYGDLRIYDLWPAKQFNNERKWAGSIMLEKELIPNLDFRGQILMGSLSGTKREFSNGTPANMYFDAKVFEYSTNFKLNVSNALIGRKAPLSFYTYAGIGFVNFRTQRKNLITNSVIESYGYNGTAKDKPTIETVVPFGGGLDYKINDNFSLNLDVSMRFVNSDKLDAMVSGNTGVYQDAYGYTSLGITYKFTQKQPYQAPVIVAEPIIPKVEIAPVDSTTKDSKQDSISNAASTANNVVADSLSNNNSNNVQATDSVKNSSFSDVDNFAVVPVIETPAPIVQQPIAEKPVAEQEIVKINNVSEKPKSSNFSNVANEQGLVFRVQIIAVQNQKDSRIIQLKKMFNLNEVIYEEQIGVWYKYTVGNFSTLEDAVKYRQQLVLKGIKDGFIVPYYLGKRITLQEAKAMQTK